jgi:hypothetical protein
LRFFETEREAAADVEDAAADDEEVADVVEDVEDMVVRIMDWRTGALDLVLPVLVLRGASGHSRLPARRKFERSSTAAAHA